MSLEHVRFAAALFDELDLEVQVGFFLDEEVLDPDPLEVVGRLLNAHDFKEGDRVEFLVNYDVFPFGIVLKGSKARIDEVQDDVVWVLLDEHHAWLDDWDNRVSFADDEVKSMNKVIKKKSGSKKGRARKLNADRGRKWCIVEAVFTDTDDTGYRTYHVIPSDPDPNAWPWKGGPSEEVEEYARERAREGDTDIGWPEWSLDDPWDGSAIEDTGDDFFYNSVPQSMTMDPDEYEELSEEERDSVDNENDTIVLQLFFHGCFDDPNDAYKHLSSIGPGSTSPKATLWDYDDDDDRRVAGDSIDSWEVVSGAVEIEFEDPTSKRKKRLRSLNPSQLKRRLTKH